VRKSYVSKKECENYVSTYHSVIKQMETFVAFNSLELIQLPIYCTVMFVHLSRLICELR
jgi:hypothetical protein